MTAGPLSSSVAARSSTRPTLCRYAPPPPADGEVQIRIKAVALNHLDVWGFRGMAFAKRKLPLVVGAEASGEIASVGSGVVLQALDAALAPHGTRARPRPAAGRGGEREWRRLSRAQV